MFRLFCRPHGRLVLGAERESPDRRRHLVVRVRERTQSPRSSHPFGAHSGVRFPGLGPRRSGVVHVRALDRASLPRGHRRPSIARRRLHLRVPRRSSAPRRFAPDLRARNRDLRAEVSRALVSVAVPEGHHRPLARRGREGRRRAAGASDVRSVRPRPRDVPTREADREPAVAGRDALSLAERAQGRARRARGDAGSPAPGAGPEGDPLFSGRSRCGDSRQHHLHHFARRVSSSSTTSTTTAGSSSARA